MNRFAFLIAFLLVVSTPSWTVHLSKAACLPQAVELSEDAPVNVLDQVTWTSASINNMVAKILMEEVLGERVLFSTQPRAGIYDFDALSNGTVAATLEVWTESLEDLIDHYTLELRTIENAGPLGVVGQSGFYVPKYVMDEHIELGTYRGLQRSDSASIFATDATAPRGTFYSSNPEWILSQSAVQLVENLNLEVEIVWTENQAATVALIDEAIQNHRPILFGYWVPEAYHEKASLPEFGPDYALERIGFPPITQACIDGWNTPAYTCDYPANILQKYISRTYPLTPDANFFLRAFTLSTSDQQYMLARMEYRDLSLEEAACDWILRNNATWTKWFLSCNGLGENGCNDDAGDCVAGECVCDYRFMGDTCEITKNIDYVAYDSTEAIFMMVLASLCIVAAFGLMVVVFVKRTRPAISFASPFFLELILFGAIGGYTAAYVWAGEPNATNCQLRYWLLTMSFITVFGNLFAKTYRIWRIFGNREMRLEVINNRFVLLLFGLVALPDIIVCLVWSAAFPLKGEVTDNHADSDQLLLQCTGDNAIVFVGVLLGYNGLVVLAGSFLAYKTRHAASYFNESKFIGFAIYNVILLAAVVVPLAFIITGEPTATYLILSVGVTFLFASTLALVMGPKVYHLLHRSTTSQWDAEMYGESVSKSTTGSDPSRYRSQSDGEISESGSFVSQSNSNTSKPDTTMI